ncbi:hypothetical protein N665_1964s0005 [Sinapis alba]|nr:hypothetical protein N665_1964s0005 [Sinapis alba]
MGLVLGCYNSPPVNRNSSPNSNLQTSNITSQTRNRLTITHQSRGAHKGIKTLLKIF